MKVRKANALQEKNNFLIDISQSVQLSGAASFAQSRRDRVGSAIGELSEPDANRLGVREILRNFFDTLAQ